MFEDKTDNSFPANSPLRGRPGEVARGGKDIVTLYLAPLLIPLFSNNLYLATSSDELKNIERSL